MNDEHYGHRAGVIHTEIESRTAKKKELEKEKQNVLEKLEKARGTDAQARQKLIDTQSLIAEYTDEIEQCKKEIMELLGSRASTTAKMQHFDTTREQIQTRKAVIARGLLEVATEAEEQNLILKKHEEELQAVQKEIAECNAKISENERELERLQKELREKQEKLKIGQTAYHRESSRLESLKNITERYDGYGNSIRGQRSTSSVGTGGTGFNRAEQRSLC